MSLEKLVQFDVINKVGRYLELKDFPAAEEVNPFTQSWWTSIRFVLFDFCECHSFISSFITLVNIVFKQINILLPEFSIKPPEAGISPSSLCPLNSENLSPVWLPVVEQLNSPATEISCSSSRRVLVNTEKIHTD